MHWSLIAHMGGDSRLTLVMWRYVLVYVGGVCTLIFSLIRVGHTVTCTACEPGNCPRDSSSFSIITAAAQRALATYRAGVWDVDQCSTRPLSVDARPRVAQDEEMCVCVG